MTPYRLWAEAHEGIVLIQMLYPILAAMEYSKNKDILLRGRIDDKMGLKRKHSYGWLY